ncbi:hypothetical protein BT96DRAFT_950436 [Gymnopus androsaceus JB14]|uniref:Uncharacterized protein n=1 Tax=Gymnopus androsaceus JB14 TaxID=1447944 RepID=A0A6A4GGV7_9AGAR|nr:hypothetical protein BT96DRAFT_950436 [Gymnopus androsaceus JB14]
MKQIQVKLDYPGNAMQHALLSFTNEPEWSALAKEIGRSFEIPSDKVAVTYINSGETFIRTQNALETFYKAHYKPGKPIRFVVKVPDPKLPIDILSQQAQKIHDKAWGKEWPHRTGQIKSTEIAKLPDDCEIEVPESLDYDCFIGIEELTEALYCPPMDVVIARGEYEKLRKYLEEAVGKNERDVYKNRSARHQFVMQQSFYLERNADFCFSIWEKPHFFLYLLLYRLKQKLPTAVQFNGSHYFVFDEHGGKRWKQWKKYSSAICLVSELPELLEIAAVVKETSGDVSQTLCHIGKVGPSIRTVLSMKKLDQPTSFENDAIKAANKLCEKASSLGVISGECQLFIPTPYLWDVFETARKALKNHDSLKLFFLLSSHALTRSAAGWNLEMRMHERMCSGGAPIDLIPASGHGELSITPFTPSTNLVPGTLAGLNQPKGASFYWMPSVSNFPGIDAVLGDTDRNIFTVQCSIAKDHSAPNDGILKASQSIPSAIRNAHSWHHVVVSDTLATAQKQGSQAVSQLRKTPREQANAQVLINMNVWYCTLYD